jgi:electron transfer flavoprotein alpha subunit
VKVLVYLEHQDLVPNPDALGIAASLSTKGTEVTAVVFAPDDADAASLAGGHAARLIHVPVPATENFPAAGRGETIASLCAAQAFDAVLFATTATSCDVAGVVAARLDAGLLPGLLALDERDGTPVATRRTLAEAVVVEAAWNTPQRVGLFRPAACPSPMENGSLVPEIVRAPYADAAGGTRYERLEPAGQGEASLKDADILVGGGRGLGTEENLQLVRDLAEALGGTFGVSLPLVDMGWAPRSRQVGQTGTVVQPRLYVACGISGQIQHRIGVERSGVIVAINKDREAPIMQFCDLGVVGDLKKIVPALTEALRQRNGTRT